MTDTQAPARPLLVDSGFLTLWGVGALNSTGRWLEMLVIAVFVLDTTNSPLLVAAMLKLDAFAQNSKVAAGRSG